MGSLSHPNSRCLAVIKLLADTHDDLADFRQLTHVKWNDATNTYDTFSYRCINIPSLVDKATRPLPPPTMPLMRVLNSHPKVALRAPLHSQAQILSGKCRNRA